MGALDCWRSKEEIEGKGERPVWLNRPTFILAAIGSAIGLGNFWRFPYLTYKYGGGYFFLPYLLSLFFMGIPLLLMELALGQKFQRGDISVFRGINKRLAGIGIASVFSAYIITWYYTVIISWSLVYFANAFKNPMPWSNSVEDFEWKCDPNTTTRPEQFFMINVLRYYDDNCKEFEDGDPSQFSVPAFFAVLVVWIFIFGAVFKGVGSSSYIVWVTVPLPVLFVIIMIIKGATLEGAGDGIKLYLFGEDKFAGLEGEALELAKEEDAKLMAGIWADAIGQIFFSIGVCMGIMTSYGSYNPVKKPIIMDNMIIAICNSLLSFIAGFAVWSIVGYLKAIDSMAASKTSGTGLVFIAYPTAIDTMNAPNFWVLLLGLTLFMLGIDSAFSMVEAAATVINDTKWGGQYPKSFVAFCLCVLGFILSIPFCTNWGYILFDAVDHYLGNFLLIVVGLMQCFGCGWGFDYENTLEKSIGHRKSLVYLSYTFWGLLFICGLVFPLMDLTSVGIIVFIVLLIFVSLIPSFFLSGLSFVDWYNDVAMCGVRKLGYSMTMLGRKDERIREWYEPFFVFYWGFCVKYLIPGTLWFILVGKAMADIKEPYGGYATKYQVMGLLVPLVGLLAFFLSICLNVYEEPFDKTQFEDLNAAVEGSVNISKVHNSKEGDAVEMAEKPAVVAEPAAAE